MLFLKNNKGRPIPTPKAFPISAYKEKIIYSNKLIQNEENTYHLIQYTDNNGNIVMPDSTIENNLYIFFILLRLFASIAIIFFIVPKLINNEQNETFVLVILGDKFRQPNESNNEKKITKHANYFFSSYALLIKRLAIKYLGINEQHVSIFVKGEEEDFDISSVVPNNKIVTQITIDEIYETEPLKSELKFIPYQNASDLLISLRSLLHKSECKNPNIILFMYDNSILF